MAGFIWAHAGVRLLAHLVDKLARFGLAQKREHVMAALASSFLRSTAIENSSQANISDKALSIYPLSIYSGFT
jgi:hypothetical protein